MDRLTSMATFVKASDMGSFAAAAEALGISPQMVAKHVTWLDHRLGARLLNRTTRRQSLTEIGRDYYERCKAVLAEADAADAVAAGVRSEPRGRLRVNAPVSFGTLALVPVVTRYLRRHPAVEVDLVLSDRFVDLIEEGFEVVFRIGPLSDSSLMSRALSPFRRFACASPTYLRERGIPTTPAELQGHECIGFADGMHRSLTEWRFLQGGRSHEVAVSTRFRVNNARALLTAALDGFGIVMVAEVLARDSLAAGTLVRILPDYEVPSSEMHMLWLDGNQTTTKLRSFIDAAVEAFGVRARPDDDP